MQSAIIISGRIIFGASNNNIGIRWVTTTQECSNLNPSEQWTEECSKRNHSCAGLRVGISEQICFGTLPRVSVHDEYRVQTKGKSSSKRNPTCPERREEEEEEEGALSASASHSICCGHCKRQQCCIFRPTLDSFSADRVCPEEFRSPTGSSPILSNATRRPP